MVISRCCKFIDKVDYTIALLDKKNIEFISQITKNVNKVATWNK
jgi:hypothetical protein